MKIKDNKGFSLVELMVSVAIVAFAIIPIIQSMTSAAMVNKKTRAMQDATLIAQNVVESFKAVSIKEILEDLSDSSGNVIGQDVVSSTIVQYEDDGAGNLVETAFDLTRTAPKYMCDIEVEAHHMKYNVSVVLDSETYNDGGGINNFKEPEIVDLAVYEKAIISDEVMEYDTKIAKYFINEADVSDRTVYNFRDEEICIVYTDFDGTDKTADIQKKIIIDVSVADGKYIVSCKVLYSVNFPYSTTITTVNEEGETIVESVTDFELRTKEVVNVYSNEFDQLPNVYLLSTVWQGEDDNMPDKLELNVDSGVVITDLITLYLIKQNNDAVDKNILDGNIDYDSAYSIIEKVDHNDFEGISNSIIDKESEKIRLYTMSVTVSNKNISPVNLTSTKEE